MAVGNIGSGGLDFSRVDLIDKKNREIQLQPIENKIKKSDNKIKLYQGIKQIIDSFYNDVVQNMAKRDLYSETNLNNSNDKVAKIKNRLDAKVQDFTLDIKNLAKNSIIQSLNYNERFDTFSNGNGTLDFSIGKNSFRINVNDKTTLDEVSELINKKSKGAIKASVFKTAQNNYRLMLKSRDSGKDNSIKVKESVGVNLRLGSYLEQNILQEAEDAILSYQGRDYTKSSNSINDLIEGVSIDLYKKGKTRVSITQDVKNIASGMKKFKEIYNVLKKNVDKATLYNSETKKVAPLYDISTLKNFMSGLLDSINSEFDKKTIYNYGINFNREGVMSINFNKFNSMITKNVDETKLFFFGKDKDFSDKNSKFVPGLFTNMDKFMSKYTKSSGYLDIESTQLNKSRSRLEEDKNKTIDRLEKKHDILLNKYIQYDEVINKMKSSLGSIGR